MQRIAFQPDRIVEQVKNFFSGIHDMSDFYYRMYLLSGLCRNCDGRGYMHTADEPCPICQTTGRQDVWAAKTPER
ncbi:MAG: hypothetical protein AB7G75_14940 [Candidatus Binatia bacterium]